MKQYRRKQPLSAKNNNHIIQFLTSEMHKQRLCEIDLVNRAGLSKDTVRFWRHQTMPRINDVEAALNVLGFTLTVKKVRSLIKSKE